MKEILITSDDGFESEGLKKLVKMLKKEFKAKITVVAPATEKSACSHSTTLTKSLRFVRVSKRFYKLDDGTPADCVYLALAALYKNRLPDLVISGINMGTGVGEDITYSGTCAGAMEAVLQGIPALALPQFYKTSERELNFKNALNITKESAEKIFNQDFPFNKEEFLNVNFLSPKNKFKDVKICKVGKRVYNFEARANTNPRGVEYFWLANANLDFEDEKNSDIVLLKQDYATITPIMLDLTAYKKMQNLKKRLKD